MPMPHCQGTRHQLPSRVGAGLALPNRRQDKERKNGIDGRAACRSQGGGKPRPYNIRLGFLFVYGRGRGQF